MLKQNINSIIQTNTKVNLRPCCIIGGLIIQWQMQWLHSSQLVEGGQYGKFKNSMGNDWVYTFLDYMQKKVLTCKMDIKVSAR